MQKFITNIILRLTENLNNIGFSSWDRVGVASLTKVIDLIFGVNTIELIMI